MSKPSSILKNGKPESYKKVNFDLEHEMTSINGVNSMDAEENLNRVRKKKHKKKKKNKQDFVQENSFQEVGVNQNDFDSKDSIDNFIPNSGQSLPSITP
jgi:hypothetical protein